MWSSVPGLARAASRRFPRGGLAASRCFSAGDAAAPSGGKLGGGRLRAAPPWRILFFGTDSFAQRALEKLQLSRSFETGKKLIEQLEVVTLPATKSGELPVRKYARMNQIPVHDWPRLGPDHFDVGIIVSFGSLLSDSVIQQFPLFDVGPIVKQRECAVPPRCTADELGAMLAEMGAEMLLSTLKNLPECIKNKREQPKHGITFAPKITVAMSWVNWEKQTMEELDQLNRAIGSRIPLRTLWMGKTVKLLELVDTQKIPVSLAFTQEQLISGTLHFHKESNILLVRCKNGWAGVKQLVLKKVLSAADFYNGYLHPYFQGESRIKQNVARFETYQPETKRKKSCQKELDCHLMLKM
ncbi:methionyl-tRNA formyltransferase, mitochondrial isoform X2 [Mustelus asterias]